jgi:beta-mannosidase
VEREHHDWSVCHARPAKTSSFNVWVASSEQIESKVDVEIRFVSVKTGSDIKGKILKSEVSIQANSTTEILSGSIDNVNEEPHVIAVRVFSNGACVSRGVDWPQPLKYLDFSERGVKVELSNGEYRVTAGKPTKGLVLEESDDIALSDNCVDVVPGDEIIIQATGTGTVINPPRYIYLGQP